MGRRLSSTLFSACTFSGKHLRSMRLCLFIQALISGTVEIIYGFWIRHLHRFTPLFPWWRATAFIGWFPCLLIVAVKVSFSALRSNSLTIHISNFITSSCKACSLINTNKQMEVSGVVSATIEKVEHSSPALNLNNSLLNLEELKVETPDWLSLPVEMTMIILGKVEQISLLQHAQFTCKLWYNLCKDPIMWKTIELSGTIVWDEEWLTPVWDRRKSHGYYDDVRMNAANRGSGSLEAIRFEGCAPGCFRFYPILPRLSSTLTRLTLTFCHFDYIHEIEQFFSMLPLLEVFDNQMSYIFVDAIEVLARNCPLLHTLRWDPVRTPNCTGIDVGMSISENLPRLRHLSISDFVVISRQGLEAILDRCTLLESLNRHSLNGARWTFPEFVLHKRCQRPLRTFVATK